MARPRVVKVGHTRWRILFSRGVVRRESDDWGYELDGVCLKERQVIAVFPLPEAPDREREVALHEVLHACFHETSLDLSQEDEEKFVTILSPRLLEVLRENPTLTAYLLR